MLAFLLIPSLAMAGKLGAARDRTGHQSSRSDHGTSNDDDDDDDCGLLLAIFTRCDEGPAEPAEVAPSAPPEDDLRAEMKEAERRRKALASPRFFLDHPYADHPGTLTRERLPGDDFVETDCEPSDTECWERHAVVTCVDDACYALGSEAPPRRFVPKLQTGRAQLFGDFGQDQDQISRFSLGLLLMSNRQLGLESRFTYWHEVLEGGGADGLWIGDVNLLYQPIAFPAVQSSFGVGPRIEADTNGAVAGVNATWITEVFPLRPFALRFEGDVGTLGSALFLEAQGSLGLVWESVEIYGGYDHMLVDDLLFASWFAGVRLQL